MSLESMLASHDDAALEALASKGLVRRARLDFEAGLVTVTARSATGATVSADGQTVTMDVRGLAQSRCTCPAGGICRHMVGAVLALRPAAARVPETQPGEPAAPVRPAIEELRELDEADLRKFAGAAWPAAVALADTSPDAAIHEEGRNCRVEFVAAAIGVTFIAGQPLKAAAYKGPKARARAVIAAAAILVRARQGVAVEVAAAGEEPQETLDPRFLGAARDAVVRIVRSVLTGTSPLAIDTLFDLAISARAEAAPRLCAQLRGLAADAGLALRRDVHFDSGRFVASAAGTVALIEGLTVSPADPELTGSLRRSYEPRASLELWMLGASSWRSETGARGLTLHAFAPLERRWHSATIARAAGQDPTFDPRAAYLQSLWSAGQPSTFMGKKITLEPASVASDGSVAITQHRPAVVGGWLGGRRALLEAGAAHASWRSLREDIAQRVGAGLRRRSAPLPAVLCPAEFRGFAFDEMAQVYEIEILDEEGAALVLTVPADSGELAQRLRWESNQFQCVCVEAVATRGEAVLRPIAIATERAGEFAVVNLDLDHWPKPGLAQAALGRLRAAVAKPGGPQPISDPIRKLTARALEAATAAASGWAAPGAEALAAECEAAGLLTLAKAIEQQAAQPGVQVALRTAYFAAEIEAAATWA